MSILNAIKEIKRDNNNLQDMALLPQYLIMQMAQRGEIQKELVPLIISKKAEIIEANARNQALVNSGQTPPTIMEQDMMEIAQAENPAPEPQMQPQMQPQMMPQEMAMPQPMPQGMPQLPEEVGIAQNSVPPMQMAGGGIIAFAPGGDVDDDLDEDDEYEELLAQAEEAEAIRNLYDMADQAYEVDNTDAGVAYAASSMPQTPAVGIKSGENKNIKEGTREKATKHTTDEDQARKYNVGNLRPSGFTYPGQIGVSKGKFAMFDSPESGLNALHHDIGIKLNRGLDTPSKFISVYAPASDNNDVKTYSGNVAKMLGIGPNDRIPNTPEAKQVLANAIIRQEGAHKATAAFAQGGIASIPKFSGVGPSLIDIDGNPLRSSPTVPRSTTTYPNYLLNEEYGYPNERERLLDEEYRKGKRPSSSKTLTDRPKDKAYIAAEKTLEEQKLRRAAMSQPKVTPGIGSLRGASIPTLALAGAGSIIEGLSGPDQVNIPTAADVNPGDLTAAEIEAAKRPALIYPRIRGKERYTSNLPVTREQIAKETTKKATPNYMPPVMLEGADNDDAARVMAMPNVAPAPAPAATPAQENADKSYFDFMQYVRDRQAKIDKTALQDQNLALLAAGLGIMGGTSPYAFANIGQGGAQGVAQLGQLQRLRAQQGIASDKLLGTASNYAAADRFRRDQLAQQKEIKEATLTSTLQKNKADWVARELKDRYGIDSMMLGQLNFKKATGDINAKDKIRLGVIEDRMREVERQAEIKFPTSTNNMKLVGTRPAG